MEEFICSFCSKNFSNKHNMKVHQMTAKYCLKLQKNEQISTNKCEHCQKTFTSKQTLIYHNRVCKKAIIHEIKDYYLKQIKELEQRYEKEVHVLKERIKELEETVPIHE